MRIYVTTFLIPHATLSFSKGVQVTELHKYEFTKVLLQNCAICSENDKNKRVENNQ